MPKSRKRKNADFQKVKLKVGKQRISATDTATGFKTRTIKVTQSWNSSSSTLQQLQTKGKLTLEDLLRRCDANKSCTQRLSALEGFKELMLEPGSGGLRSSFDKIMIKVAVLLNDPERTVRQAVIKLCRAAFPLVSAQDSGFFDTFSTHLCLAMSHISDDVRHDALILFDLLLEKYSERVIGEKCRLVPSLIDQINTHVLTGPSESRSVAFTLTGLLSSPQWRLQVLQRLKTVVDTFVARDKADTVPVHCEPEVYRALVDYPASRGPVIPTAYKKLWATQARRTLTEPEQEYTYLTQERDKLAKFISSVLPLVRQCWMEQFSSQDAGKATGAGPTLTEDSLPMLRTGLGVLHSFVQCWWCWYTHHSRPFVTDCWFRDTFLPELREMLLPVFPLVIMERKGRAKKGQKAGTAGDTAQTSSPSALQTLTLKMNLMVCEMLTSFPSSESGTAVMDAARQPWHKVILTFLLKNLRQCTGVELSQHVTTVLNRVFFHFPSSEKQEKLLAKAVKQFAKVHLLSADKRAYLALFADLAFDTDQYSPYHASYHHTGRHAHLQSFFVALVQLLLQLRGKDGAGVIAEQVTKVISHGSSPVLTDVLRQHMKEFLGTESCVFVTLPVNCHPLMVTAIKQAYVDVPVPEDVLEMVETVARQPAVDRDVARHLVLGLLHKFSGLLKDADRKNLPNKQETEDSKMVYTRFLFSLLVGHKRVELEELAAAHSWQTGGLSRVVWTGDKAQLDRQQHILRNCCMYFPDYLEGERSAVPYGTAVIEVMGEIWTRKILNKYCALSVHTVYGALFHWLEMTSHMSDTEIYHLDDAPAPPTVCPEDQANWRHCRDLRLSKVKANLRPFTKLTFSLLYSMVAMDTAEEEVTLPEEGMQEMMWDLAMALMKRSLLMMLDLLSVMATFVEGERTERESMRAVLVMTRLMTDDQLDMHRRLYRKQIDPHLSHFVAVVQTATPRVHDSQWWQDFIGAISVSADVS